MQKEPSTKIVMTAPAVETLFARDRGSPWPDIVFDDPNAVRQTEVRQALHTKLEEVFERIPNPTTDLLVAVEKRSVEPEAATELYDLLTAFLDADLHHARLVLYLPFEVLPSRSHLVTSPALKSASDRFARSYMRCWRTLLEVTDVRANFDDGNILEPELAPNGQPMVRKAAHLIPQLVRKGLIEISEVTEIMENASDDILKGSIADALQVLALDGAKTKDDTKEAPPLNSPENLPEELAFEVQKLDMREALDTSRGMPRARVAWERRNNADMLIERYAKRIAQAFAIDRMVWEDFPPLLSDDNAVVCLAAMRGIRFAVEGLRESDRVKAIRLCEKFNTYIRLDMPNILDFSDELESLLAHWAYLGFIHKEADLRRFGFRSPKLDVRFLETDPLATELKEFNDVIQFIASDPECSRLLYPVAIFFGSRLKGYAKKDADLDAAVFVRPGIAKSEREKVRGILARIFGGERIGGKVVEFWLKEEGQGLGIRDFPNPDVFLADSTWVHLLFGSVWLGSEGAIKELYERLLPGFLYSEGKTFEGRDIRKLCLDEMEREVLQYRLLHKGYRRLFPPPLYKEGEGVVGPNPASTFWDSGYRRLATKLFISR
ncbi:MAG: nucleotidyltransferase domain-containing protein, partial [Parcubacteria group bacterium]|nr:nucleotidyltransferase domain-containing protein [Parcubacteria group bacterium]